jgi:peptidyl-prolyl cis-trans isomerase C
MRLLIVSFIIVQWGCGQSRTAAGPGPAVRPVSSEPVLASVNGSPILASDLAGQLRAGQEPQQALRELIRRELLVQEASRRGLDRDPRVNDAQRRAMVELFIRRTFRDQLGPKQIPRELVEQAWEKNKYLYQHPELREVRYLLAKADKKSTPAAHAAAKALAGRWRALATSRPHTPEEFMTIPRQAAPPADIAIEANPIITALRGTTVESFADATFALSRPGDVSPVVQSIYGYHVIYLVRTIPPENKTTLREAEDEVRAKFLEEARTILLQELIAKLEKENQVRLLPENLTKSGSEARP